MKNIRVTFRAVFEFPIGPLNPMNLRMPGPQPVEVFNIGERWFARTISSSVQYRKLAGTASASSARHAVEAAFRKQLEPWQTWGTPPSDPRSPVKPEARMLLPDEIAETTGKHGVSWGWKEVDDYTHLIDPQGNGRVPPALCGAFVKATSFIDGRSNLIPTCKVCAAKQVRT